VLTPGISEEVGMSSAHALRLPPSPISIPLIRTSSASSYHSAESPLRTEWSVKDMMNHMRAHDKSLQDSQAVERRASRNAHAAIHSPASSDPSNSLASAGAVGEILAAMRIPSSAIVEGVPPVSVEKVELVFGSAIRRIMAPSLDLRVMLKNAEEAARGAEGNKLL